MDDLLGVEFCMKSLIERYGWVFTRVNSLHRKWEFK
jgi:hypothetical protein